MKNILMHINQEDKRIIPILSKIGVKIDFVFGIDSNLVKNTNFISVGQYVTSEYRIEIIPMNYFYNSKKSSFIRTVWHEVIHAVNHHFDYKCFDNYNMKNFDSIIISESIAEIVMKKITGYQRGTEEETFISDIMYYRWGINTYTRDEISSYVYGNYAVEMRNKILDFIKDIYVF